MKNLKKCDGQLRYYTNISLSKKSLLYTKGVYLGKKGKIINISMIMVSKYLQKKKRYFIIFVEIFKII